MSEVPQSVLTAWLSGAPCDFWQLDSNTQSSNTLLQVLTEAMVRPLNMLAQGLGLRVEPSCRYSAFGGPTLLCLLQGTWPVLLPSLAEHLCFPSPRHLSVK